METDAQTHTPGPLPVAFRTPTPGPWIATPFHDVRQSGAHADGYDIEAHPDFNNGFSVAVVSGSREMHANARLIAAAPDMLAALQDFISARDLRSFQLTQAAAAKARAAIAKATGKA